MKKCPYLCQTNKKIRVAKLALLNTLRSVRLAANHLRVAGQLPFGVENMGSNPIQTTDTLSYKVTHKVLRCGSSKTNAPVDSSSGSHFRVTGHLPFGVENMGSNPLSTTYRGIEQQAVLAGLITQRSEVRILLPLLYG